MKLLVLALDGMDKGLAETFEMPFLQSLLAERHQVDITEDLWGRGWTKVLSGKPATETGAFYEQPALDGTPTFTQKFGSGDYPIDPDMAPLWQRINDAGLRAAWLGPPTTLPAPSINGWFLAGAGGGFSPAGVIPELACTPARLHASLAEHHFNWECRFVVSGIQNTDSFIEACEKAVVNRTNFLIKETSEEAAFDFAFYFEKETVILTNIYANYIVDSDLRQSPTFSRLSRFFLTLDQCIQRLSSSLNPESVIVVSDHGLAPLKRLYNLNRVLHPAGLLATNTEDFKYSKKPCKEDLRTRLRKRIVQALAPHISKDLSPIATPKGDAIDYAESQAFAHFYCPGVFVNDSRFGGPVADKDVLEVAKKSVDAINQNQQLRDAGFSARLFRSEYSRTRAKDLLPDVWCDAPIDSFPEQRGEVLQPNPLYCDFELLSRVPRDIGSGKKSPKALLAVEAKYADGLPASGDLTIAYDAILSHLGIDS